MIEIKTIKEWNTATSKLDSMDNESLHSMASHFDCGLEVKGKVIVVENPSKAFNIYKKAYKKGHAESALRLADFYSEGEVCKKNIPLAKKLYKKRILEKDYTAVHNLATVYRDLGNYSKAFSLYKLEKKYSKMNPIELAYCYYYGIGTTVNKRKALSIFQKIIVEKGHSMCDVDDSNYYIGLCYLEGKLVKKSIKKARRHLNEANIDDDHRSANELLLIIGRN